MTRPRTGMRRMTAALAIAACALLGGNCFRYVSLALEDPVFDGDAFDLVEQRIVELAPETPRIEPGPDGEFGTDDDITVANIVGDVDLVLRTGITDFVGGIPDPSPLFGEQAIPEGVAEPFGRGTPIAFVVVASDGKAPGPYGNAVVPPYVEGLPVLVMAFADLDGDGFIGVTLLDGDPLDVAIEEAELEPVARRFAIASGGQASGVLAIEAGGPAGARLRVVLTAATWAGPYDPSFFEGKIPDGPAIMTKLPMLPRTEPNRVLQGGPLGPPTPTSADDLVGVEIGSHFTPDPSEAYGEAFTIRADGSEASVDVARIGSGAFRRFALVQRPDPAAFRTMPSRPLRIGFGVSGSPVAYEVLARSIVPDDGSETQTTLRVVPVDQLGNIADLTEEVSVTLRTGGTVRIISPDFDGDPTRETLLISDSHGAAIVVDDSGARFDDANEDFVAVEGGGGLCRIDIFLPDPDVDDSGIVDPLDLEAIAALDRLEVSDAGFDPTFDLNGDGRIDKVDAAVIEEHLGELIPTP
ncbi:MAG: hypothetical protein ACE5FL_00045 [Myxococcota bacterium]